MTTTRALDDLLQIVRNGGSLDIKADGYSTEDLVQLARNAQENCRIILRGISQKSADELVHICRNGAGKVIIVF